MKRRGFLGLLGVAVAVPFVPIAPTAAPVSTGIDLAAGPDYTTWVIRREFVEVTCFGDTNKVYMPARAYLERVTPERRA